MQIETKPYKDWQTIARAPYAGHCLSYEPGNAFTAACDASRGGKVTRLIKADGSAVTYHNGSKVY
jgi:hypothetical protein